MEQIMKCFKKTKYFLLENEISERGYGSDKEVESPPSEKWNEVWDEAMINYNILKNNQIALELD